MWEDGININDVKEIRLKTTVFFGVGAIKKIGDIAGALKKRGIDSVLCVTGKHSYKATGAWDYVRQACAEHGIAVTLYDKVTPNPTTLSINEAARLGAEHGAGAVIAIGGGSAIDAGKSAAVLLTNPGRTAEELYSGQFAPDTAAPIVAVNLTHGTGSEGNRFAVATITELNHKPAIAFDCLYPLYSIDDPELMSKLGDKQSCYTSVDAVNHCIEAATTLITNPLAILLAKESIRLVAKYLPLLQKNPADLRARYFLAYAALIAGASFDNGLLHYTHALEHPLSGVKPDLTHGLGLAMIVPAVVEVCYPAVPEVMADILAPLVPHLKGTPDEAHKAAQGLETWLNSVGVTEKLADEGFGEGDIARLVELAENTPSLGLMLSVAPVPSTPERIGAIYRQSLKPMQA